MYTYVQLYLSIYWYLYSRWIDGHIYDRYALRVCRRRAPVARILLNIYIYICMYTYMQLYLSIYWYLYSRWIDGHIYDMHCVSSAGVAHQWRESYLICIYIYKYVHACATVSIYLSIHWYLFSMDRWTYIRYALRVVCRRRAPVARIWLNIYIYIYLCIRICNCIYLCISLCISIF